jgi:hypothetical protein
MEYTTPMAEKNHPELDISELLDCTGIDQQILVWAFDICITTMSG